MSNWWHYNVLLPSAAELSHEQISTLLTTVSARGYVLAELGRGLIPEHREEIPGTATADAVTWLATGGGTVGLVKQVADGQSWIDLNLPLAGRAKARAEAWLGKPLGGH